MSEQPHPRGPVRWVFENRSTGGITIAQWPNIPLALFLVCVVVRSVAKPSGTAGQALNGAGNVALVIWAGDELLRGVNPFRRFLGASVLAGQVLALVRALTA